MTRCDSLKASLAVRRLLIAGVAMVLVLGLSAAKLSVEGTARAYAATQTISTTQVQWDLAGLGYLPWSGIDGVYGPQTTAAVRTFQSNVCIAVDGIAGPQTDASLSTVVVEVQSRVGAAQDGLFGPQTKAGVEAYQQAHGLSVDGQAGPITMGSMGITRVHSCGSPAPAPTPAPRTPTPAPPQPKPASTTPAPATPAPAQAPAPTGTPAPDPTVGTPSGPGGTSPGPNGTPPVNDGTGQGPGGSHTGGGGAQPGKAGGNGRPDTGGHQATAPARRVAPAGKQARPAPANACMPLLQPALPGPPVSNHATPARPPGCTAAARPPRPLAVGASRPGVRPAPPRGPHRPVLRRSSGGRSDWPPRRGTDWHGLLSWVAWRSFWGWR